ncbi:MAG: hypothetical protein K0S41_3522, partial [Anaerocolumna sp.]|nr:hypothetical protein [Anaerocolumna sp.]
MQDIKVQNQKFIIERIKIYILIGKEIIMSNNEKSNATYRKKN